MKFTTFTTVCASPPPTKTIRRGLSRSAILLYPPPVQLPAHPSRVFTLPPTLSVNK